MSSEELGGAEMHCGRSGVTDHLAVDDTHALHLARLAIENLNVKKSPDVQITESEVGRGRVC